VTLIERRVTPAGRIWGATRRDGAIFPQAGVAARLGTADTRRSRRLVLQKMAAVAGASIVLTGLNANDS
jgi:hypothetical protein